MTVCASHGHVKLPNRQDARPPVPWRHNVERADDVMLLYIVHSETTFSHMTKWQLLCARACARAAIHVHVLPYTQMLLMPQYVGTLAPAHAPCVTHTQPLKQAAASTPCTRRPPARRPHRARTVASPRPQGGPRPSWRSRPRPSLVAQRSRGWCRSHLPAAVARALDHA